MSTRLSITVTGERKAAPGIVGAFGGTNPSEEIAFEAESSDLVEMENVTAFLIASGHVAATSLAAIRGDQTQSQNQEV